MAIQCVSIMATPTTLKPLWDGFEYKEHQVFGVNWMLERESEEDKEKVKGGILCDEMGLGKTIQMIGLIKESGTSFSSTLLVAPLAVLNQWKETAEKAKIRCFFFNTKMKNWQLKTNPFKCGISLYLIGYESLANNIRFVEQKTFDRLVCDEAHRLGVPNIKRKVQHLKPINKLCYNTILRIACQADSKWFLTATPVVNSLDDTLSLFALMDSKLLKKPLDELMSVYALARSMEQLRVAMPDGNFPLEPIIKNHRLDFITKQEEDFYVKIQTDVERQLRYQDNALVILRLIMLLRQISIHPQIYIKARQDKFKGKLTIPSFEQVSSKFEKVQDLLKSESHEPHKWIIFCHFHEEMNLFENYLQKLDFIRHIEVYSGSQSIHEKTEALDKIRQPFEAFNDKRCDVILMQIKAGGVGINLQECDRVIFCSPWWTQAAIEQGIGRAVRIGQKNQVIVHNLVLKQEEDMGVRNIDRWMREKADEKDGFNDLALSYANSNLS